MRLTFAMLADAATTADGKLFVLGGGWNEISVSTLPAVHSSFTLAFVLEIGAAEPPGEIPFIVELLHGNASLAAVRGEVSIGNRRDWAGHSAQIANQVSFHAVELPSAGRYECRVTAGTEHLGSIDLFVTQE